MTRQNKVPTVSEWQDALEAAMSSGTQSDEGHTFEEIVALCDGIGRRSLYRLIKQCVMADPPLIVCGWRTGRAINGRRAYTPVYRLAKGKE